VRIDAGPLNAITGVLLPGGLGVLPANSVLVHFTWEQLGDMPSAAGFAGIDVRRSPHAAASWTSCRSCQHPERAGAVSAAPGVIAGPLT
jgi:hypothetical protein